MSLELKILRGVTKDYNMRQRQSYSKEYKDAIRTKILSRGSKTVAKVYKAEGINQRSAANWISARVNDLVMKKQYRCSRLRNGLSLSSSN